MRPVMLAILLMTATSQGLASEPHPVILQSEARDLTDSRKVLDTMLESGAEELPIEALAYYRRGLAALESDPEAAAKDFEIAAKLDPAFPEAHLALARLHLFKNPRRSLEKLGDAARAATGTFESQHLLVTNAVLGLLVLFTVGFTLCTAYNAFQHLPRVHHSLVEYFKIWFNTPLAAMLAILVLVVPFLWGVGWFPLTVSLSGLLWAWLRPGERRWAAVLGGTLILAPFLLWLASPILLSPLDPAERPQLLSRAMTSPYSEGLVTALERAVDEHPEDADLHYALGMIQKRGNRLRQAGSHYEKALEYGADPAAVKNNLGVLAFLRKDYDRAMELLLESVDHDPERAASHFNLSQTYGKKLYFEKADQELTKANRLDIERVRATMRYSEGDDRRTLLDEPLSAMAFWKAAWSSDRSMPAVPGWMVRWFPGSLWLSTPVALLCFFLTLTVGRRLFRSLPSFDCTNCGRPVCRRCLRRIRRSAYCSPCGDALLRIQSSSYSKLVLSSRIRRKRRLASFFLRITTWLLPGFHALRMGRSTTGSLLALAASGAGLALVRHGLPVTRMVWMDMGPGPWWPGIPIAILATVFVLSAVTVVKIKPDSVLIGNTAPQEDDDDFPRTSPEQAA